MATTDAEVVLAAVATTPGARLWCLGDPHQAQAVRAGGLGVELARLGERGHPAPALTENRRQLESGERQALARYRAGLVYLSGGNPGYLADTLRGSAVLKAMMDAWAAGAALAGCSAGAMALTAIAEDVTARRVRPGLGLLPHLSLICHFGRPEECWPGTRRRREQALLPGQVLVGLEEAGPS